MTGQPKRDEPRHEPAAATDEAQGEEVVRRIALRFLATPPQPKKTAQAAHAKRKKPAKPQEG